MNKTKLKTSRQRVILLLFLFVPPSGTKISYNLTKSVAFYWN